MRIALLRLLALVVFLGTWEAYGTLVDATWISRPVLIADKVWGLVVGPLWPHLGISLLEMVLGLVIGVPLGVVIGILLGLSPRAANLSRPLIVALYSIPLVTLAPVLILWFGIDLKPKVFLVAATSFFLLFFNTFSGAQSIDRDLIQSLQLMGASKREVGQKVIAQACVAWIYTGLKVALPYALISTTVGEMMASRAGLGYLLTRSLSQMDIDGMYAVLAILMAIGVTLGQGAIWSERRLLRWRGENVG